MDKMPMKPSVARIGGVGAGTHVLRRACGCPVACGSSVVPATQGRRRTLPSGDRATLVAGGSPHALVPSSSASRVLGQNSRHEGDDAAREGATATANSSVEGGERRQGGDHLGQGEGQEGHHFESIPPGSGVGPHAQCVRRGGLVKEREPVAPALPAGLREEAREGEEYGRFGDGAFAGRLRMKGGCSASACCEGPLCICK